MKKDETLNAYQTAIRWGAFDRAEAFRSRPETSVETEESLREIHVTSYDVVAQRDTGDGETQTFHQRVTIRYYRNGDLVEKTVMDEQDWRYDADAGRWVLETPLPRFK